MKITPSPFATLLFVTLLYSPHLKAQQPIHTPATAPATTGAVAPPPSPDFLKRLINAYALDWHPSRVPPSTEPAPPRRLYESPLDAPPFPSADWTYGGSPVIGEPDTSVYPLMSAIYGNKDGDAWKRSHVKIYGWFNGGFNVSSSNKGKFANAPTSYYVSPNTVTADQEVLFVERLPDTVQTSHFDWGFRLTQLYGQDYRYTTAHGYFSQQLLQKNNLYGYDPVMMYVDLYYPHVAQGLNIRMGRYISLPDIEAQLSPNNYTYSHSLLYTVDPYTQTGIMGTLRLKPTVLVQAGFSGGNDVAPWTKDATPTFTACVSVTFRNGKDNLYPCVNSLNGGKYAYNNIQMFVNTWYHKISPTWHTDTEAYYMYERGVPAINGPITPEIGANPAYCSSGEARCFAPEWAFVNYVEHEFSKRSSMTLRTDFLNDLKGQRTGYQTKYSEFLAGYNFWVGSTVTIRPEIRYEHSYDAKAYDNGTKQNQGIIAGDVIYHF